MLDAEAGDPPANRSWVEGLAADYTRLDLEGAGREMLDHAVKLTKTPAASASVDIERLRGAGLDDRGIHDLCPIAACFAFVNHLADGLGVELEERFGE